MTIDQSIGGRNASMGTIGDDKISMKSYHRSGSVPARFLQPMGRAAEKDFDPDFGKPWIPKRKRGSI
jgi:hypothetical protein